MNAPSRPHPCPACLRAAEQGYGGEGLPAIGIDSVFNQRSELYNPRVEAGEYYNASEGSADMSPSGVPYGERGRETAGLPRHALPSSSYCAWCMGRFHAPRPPAG